MHDELLDRGSKALARCAAAGSGASAMKPASTTKQSIAMHGGANVSLGSNRKVSSHRSMQDMRARARDALRAYRRQKSTSESAAGNGHAGSKLDQRPQHERASAHSRMRDLEAWVMQAGAADEQDIEIKSPRQVPLMLPHAPMPALDCAQRQSNPSGGSAVSSAATALMNSGCGAGESIGALT
jgi:hypothetical protein